ncbi:MAG: TIR domain-containing protein [Bacilli bacterium]
MSENEVKKKVFISYSWTSDEHVAKVISLAQYLVYNGVDAIIDKWDLEVGNDKYKFMEKMVNDDSVDKVLMILDSGYKEKANQRAGGVGVETQIISSTLYDNNEKNKFLPISFEKDNEGKPYLPTFVANRLYLDLTGEGIDYSTGLEQLLRTIYQFPDQKKPKLGKRPEFLTNETLNPFQFSYKANEIEAATSTNPSRINNLVKIFLDMLIDESEEYLVKESQENIQNEIIGKINELLEVRHAYIKVLESILQSSKKSFSYVIYFFEDFNNKIDELQKKPLGLYEYQVESNEFLLHELFLITVSKLIKFEEWNLLKELVTYKYEYRRLGTNYSFIYFRPYLSELEKYKASDGGQVPSVSGKLIKDRTKSKRELMEIVDSDLFLHYVSKFDKSGTILQDSWFPEMYTNFEYGYKMKVISKMKSKKYVDQLLPIFETDFNTLVNYVEKEPRLQGFQNLNTNFGMPGIPLFKQSIKANNIGEFD